MEEKKRYSIYYDEENYIASFLEEKDILNGYLSEAKAFNIFFDNMIMCNDYFKNNDFTSIEYLVDAYNDEEDYYADEYQYFIVDFSYTEEIIAAAVKKMGNTLYYDNEKDLYIMGATDLGTSRTIVPTDLKVKELKNGK